MTAPNPYTPIFKTVVVTSAGQSVDLGTKCGFVCLRSIGPDPVFVATGSVAPTATRGAGRYCALADEPVPPWVNCSIQYLAFRCAAGKTATVEIVAIPAALVEGNPAYAALGGGAGPFIGIAPSTAAGKLISWAPTAGTKTGANPGDSLTKPPTVCNIDITGCNSLVSSVPAFSVSGGEGTMLVEALIDGAWTTIWSGKLTIASGAVLTSTNVIVDVSGKSAITGFRYTLTNTSGLNNLTLAVSASAVKIALSSEVVANVVNV